MSSDSDSDVPQAPIQRKEWPRTGNVPRSTLMRWMQQDPEPGPSGEDLDGSSTDNEENNSDDDEGEEEDSEEPNDGEEEVEENESDNEVLQDIIEQEIMGQDEEMSIDGDQEEFMEAEGHEEFMEARDQEDVDQNRGENNVEEELVEFHPEELFRGSKLTCGQTILGLMQIYSEHAITKSCLADFVKFFHGALPLDNSFPSSYYYLEQTLQPFMPPELTKEHVCCGKCGFYIGVVTRPAVPCPLCQSTKVTKFQEFCLSSLIKYLFEKRNLADAIDAYGPGKGADITRSEEYMRIKQNLQGQYDVILHWNFDGVKTHNNSASSMWPVMFNVVDVAPQLRETYTMIAGLWYAPKKPPLNSYLQPFAESLVKLSTEGVSWVHPRTHEEHVSKVFAPVLSVDAPARAMAQNLLQYNGEFSCNICEVEGMELKRGPKSRKRVVPFEEEPAPLRTKDSMKAAAVRAEEENVIVKGVKGSTILEAIPECDSAKSVTLDYMHLVLLGVVRTFFKLWFTNKGPDWYIGKETKAVTTFLKSLRPTYETTRCPNDAEKWKSFKASTWRTWLLFVSLPALKGVLKEKYFQHWTLLVMGIALLLQEDISENELLLSEHLLSLFVRDTQELYGYSAMTYNLHGLLHLPLITRRWGALWAVSLFKFESTNGILTRLLHGTIRITAELSNTLRLIIATNTLKVLLDGNGIENRAHPQFQLLSQTKCRDSIPAAGRNSIAVFFPDEHQLTFFARAQRGKTIFTSEIYTREKTTDNQHVCFRSGNLETYGVVQCFIQCGGEKYALVAELEVEPDKFFKIPDIDVIIKHLIPVKDSNNFSVILLSQIVCKLFRVDNFLCKELNHFEQKL